MTNTIVTTFKSLENFNQSRDSLSWHSKMFELCLCLYWQSNNRLELTANGDFKNSDSKHIETNTFTTVQKWLEKMNLRFHIWTLKIQFRRKKYWPYVWVLAVKCQIQYRKLYERWVCTLNTFEWKSVHWIGNRYFYFDLDTALHVWNTVCQYYLSRAYIKAIDWGTESKDFSIL